MRRAVQAGVRLLLGPAALLLAASACDEASSPPATPAAHVHATARERPIVERILDRLGGSAVTDVRLGRPPDLYRRARRSRGARWITVTVRTKTASLGARATFGPAWQGRIVASTLADALPAAGLAEQVAGSSLVIRTRDGRLHREEDGVLRGRAVGPHGASWAALRFRRAAAQAGFAVSSLRVVSPWPGHVAPVVALRAPKGLDGARALRRFWAAAPEWPATAGEVVTIRGPGRRLLYYSGFDGLDEVHWLAPGWVCPDPFASGPWAPCPAG